MIELNKESVARRIKNVRKSMGLTLKDFSQLLGIPLTSINSWERAVSVPNKQNFQILSEKTNIPVEWFKYGSVVEYAQDVFDYYKLNEKIPEETFFELVKELEESNFEPGDINTFINVAKVRIKDFLSLIEETQGGNKKSKSAQALIKEYPIVENSSFQEVYLFMLQSLLNEENGYKEDNDQIMRFVLDMLSRMDNKSKPLFKRLIKDLNWLFTNNVFLFEKKYQSENASYGSLRDSILLEQKKEREWVDINKDMEEIIQQTIIRIKDIVALNYEEFKRSEYKSIF